MLSRSVSMPPITVGGMPTSLRSEGVAPTNSNVIDHQVKGRNGAYLVTRGTTNYNH
jgi:hypothetical protein